MTIFFLGSWGSGIKEGGQWSWNSNHPRPIKSISEPKKGSSVIVCIEGEADQGSGIQHLLVRKVEEPDLQRECSHGEYKQTLWAACCIVSHWGSMENLECWMKGADFLCEKQLNKDWKFASLLTYSLVLYTQPLSIFRLPICEIK